MVCHNLFKADQKYFAMAFLSSSHTQIVASITTVAAVSGSDQSAESPHKVKHSW